MRHPAQHPEREFEFVVDWNTPVYAQIMTLWQGVGVGITYDSDTWMVHIHLLFIRVAFGVVEKEYRDLT